MGPPWAARLSARSRYNPHEHCEGLNEKVAQHRWPDSLFAAASPPLLAQWPPIRPPRPQDARWQAESVRARSEDSRRKPDLSGVWEHVDGSVSAATPAPSPTSGGPPVATFANIGAGFPEGLPLRPWAADLLKKRKEENSKDNPDAHCLPMGLMQFHIHPQPRKIIQTPSVMVILYEGNAGIREIFTDGRTLPNNDPQPWWFGYSVGSGRGHVRGRDDGLQVRGWLDIWGSPLTDAAKLRSATARQLRNSGNCVTIDDPKLTPNHLRWNRPRIMLDGELIEFICAENEKSVAHMVGK